MAGVVDELSRLTVVVDAAATKGPGPTGVEATVIECDGQCLPDFLELVFGVEVVGADCFVGVLSLPGVFVAFDFEVVFEASIFEVVVVECDDHCLIDSVDIEVAPSVIAAATAVEPSDSDPESMTR